MPDVVDGQLRSRPVVGPVWLGFIGLALAVVGQLQLNRYLLWGLIPAAMALALWALRGVETSDDRNHSLTIINVGLAVALGMHFWHLGQSLPGLFFDEAANIAEGLELATRPGWQIWSDELSGRPTLFLYFLGYLQLLIGEQWLVARTAVVVVNALTVLVMVWALHPILGPRTARIAAIVYGATAYHLLFSRIVYEASVSSLLLLVAVGAAARAVRDDRRRWWLAMGSALGVGLWTYAAFRLVPVLICAALVGWAIAKRGYWRRIVAGIAVAAAVALLLASPLIWVFVSNPDRVTLRARETTILQNISDASSLQPLVDNVTTYGLMFFANPENSDKIYYAPALGTPAAVLLWVGLGLAVGSMIRRRRAVAVIFVFWWIAGLIPGIITLSIEAPHWCRTLYALPAVAVMVALGVEGVVRLAGRRWQTVALTGVLAIVVVGEAWAWHSRIEDVPRVYGFFSPWSSRAGEIARHRVADGYRVLVSGDLVNSPYINVVFWTVAGREAAPEIAPLTLWENAPLPGSSQPTSILLSDQDHRLVEFFSDLHPESELIVHRNRWREPLLREVRIPARVTPPSGKHAGVLFRATGEYRFSMIEGTALELEGMKTLNGDRLHVPAGIWQVVCDPSCAEAGVRVSGPEDFLLRDNLFADPWKGHGLSATYTDADGSSRTQLDRILSVNERAPEQPPFQIRWNGWLKVPTDGTYLFRTVSDDGCRIWIADRLVVDNWGGHNMDEKQEQLELGKGEHSFLVEYEELGGGVGLMITWQPPWLDEPESIPLSLLRPLVRPQLLDSPGPTE